MHDEKEMYRKRYDQYKKRKTALAKCPRNIYDENICNAPEVETKECLPGKHVVICRCCLTQGPIQDTRQEAVTGWNHLVFEQEECKGV